MELAKGSLVIVDAHTETPTVYFKGRVVDTLEGIKVSWDQDTNKVMLIVHSSALAQEMTAAGIKVRRAE